MYLLHPKETDRRQFLREIGKLTKLGALVVGVAAACLACEPVDVVVIEGGLKKKRLIDVVGPLGITADVFCGVDVRGVVGVPRGETAAIMNPRLRALYPVVYLDEKLLVFGDRSNPWMAKLPYGVVRIGLVQHHAGENEQADRWNEQALKYAGSSCQ